VRGVAAGFSSTLRTRRRLGYPASDRPIDFRIKTNGVSEVSVP
jgi:hypothetical protein